MEENKNLENEKEEIVRKHNLTRYMKFREVCIYVGCKPTFLKEEIRRKNIVAYKIVREIVFDPKDVEAWIKRKKKAA